VKALFICDEKEEWNLLRNIFHAHFPKIELVCVQKGQDALETLTYEGPIGMVIIECALKNDHPTELAELMFDQAGPRPVLFVGTSTMIKDRVSEEFFSEYEMVSIYQKPYNALEFKKSVQKAIDWVKQEEFENSIVELNAENFIPLKLRNFYLYSSVPFDVYVELTRTKFIKAISANKEYTQSTIQDFQKRNIRYLYLEKNEHLNFLENSIKKISKNLDLNNDNPRKKIQSMIAGVLVIHQYLQDVGISDSLHLLLDQVIKQFPKVVSFYPNLKTLILDFPMEQGDLAEQAILKGLLAESMAAMLGWSSDLSRMKLGLAAIMHDCFLDRDSWSTITYEDHPELDYLTEDQKKSFLEHPRKAAEMARQFTKYPDADFIIEQHHELPDGNGFPGGIHASKITKISAVFILANNFVIQLVVNGLTPSSIKSIMGGFASIYSVGNFKEVFKELQKAIKKKQSLGSL
jgi:hypothetical protein